jgi:hypothetical protein
MARQTPVILHGQSFEGPDDAEPRIRDHGIDASELLLGLRDRRLEVAVAGDVAVGDHCPSPHALDLCGERLQPFPAAGREHHVRALARRFPGYGGTDPGGGAGDEGHGSRPVSHCATSRPPRRPTFDG